MNFLTIEESTEISQKYPDVEFDFWYARLKSSDTIRIMPATKLNNLSGFEAVNIEKICPAVPADFVAKIKKQTVIEVKEVLSTVEKIKNEYDFINEEAWLFGCEDYISETFLDWRICRQLWILNIKQREITGWAYYYKMLNNPITRKVAEIVELRPLVSADFKSDIFHYKFVCPAVTNNGYPELTTREFSYMSLSKMSETQIRNAVLKAIEGKTIYDSDKIRFVSQSGVVKELNVFFETEQRNKVELIIKKLQEVKVSFPLEARLEFVENRYIINHEKIPALLEEIDAYIGDIPENRGDIQTKIDGNDWGVKKLF